MTAYCSCLAFKRQWPLIAAMAPQTPFCFSIGQLPTAMIPVSGPRTHNTLSERSLFLQLRHTGKPRFTFQVPDPSKTISQSPVRSCGVFPCLHGDPRTLDNSALSCGSPLHSLQGPLTSPTPPPPPVTPRQDM